jgi:lysozyme
MSDAMAILLASLKAEEGLRLSPYLCTAGRLTIGYGHNMDAKPLEGDTAATYASTGMITRDQAERLLVEDATPSLAVARKLVRNFDALTPNRQAVLAEMVYQLGPAGAMAFRGTRKAIEAQDYAAAAAGMLASKWAKQTSARVKRLAQRMLKG